MGIGIVTAPPRLVDFSPPPISVDEYHRLIKDGTIYECVKIELLNGMLVVKDRSSRGGDRLRVCPRHAHAIMGGEDLLKERLAPLGHLVRSQCPITIPPWDEPEPDLQIGRGPRERYRHGHPRPADVCVAIEVADNSLERDRGHKLRVYARASIPQYVILNLADNVVEVYAEPDVEAGTYADILTVARGGTVTLRLFDGQTLDVSANDLLP